MQRGEEERGNRTFLFPSAVGECVRGWVGRFIMQHRRPNDRDIRGLIQGGASRGRSLVSRARGTALSSELRRRPRSGNESTDEETPIRATTATTRNRSPCIRFRTTFANTVLEAMVKRGWEQETGDGWDLLWLDKHQIHEDKDRFYFSLQPHQRLSHFPNHYELTRKDLLHKNLKKTKRRFEKDGNPDEAASYDFFPTTFNMPAEYAMFVEEFKRRTGTVWIMKPVGKAQGKGIFLFKKLSDVSDWRSNNPRDSEEAPEQYVVQRYIANPYLVGGKKFDLRLYALVTSFQPLVVYMYREGFARFSVSRFTQDIDNDFVHLTNIAVQKNAPEYKNAKSGCKWSVRDLKLYMISKHGAEAVNECFRQMERIIVYSLLAVQKAIIHDKHCFELYGFDIMLDGNLKAWLIEVNASPSMSANTGEDHALKMALLGDTLDTIDMEGKLKGNESQVGGFDLVYKNGWVRRNYFETVLASIGTENSRNCRHGRMERIDPKGHVSVS